MCTHLPSSIFQLPSVCQHYRQIHRATCRHQACIPECTFLTSFVCLFVCLFCFVLFCFVLFCFCFVCFYFEGNLCVQCAKSILSTTAGDTTPLPPSSISVSYAAFLSYYCCIAVVCCCCPAAPPPPAPPPPSPPPSPSSSSFLLLNLLLTASMAQR